MTIKHDLSYDVYQLIAPDGSIIMVSHYPEEIEQALVNAKCEN